MSEPDKGNAPYMQAKLIGVDKDRYHQSHFPRANQKWIRLNNSTPTGAEKPCSPPHVKLKEEPIKQTLTKATA